MTEIHRHDAAASLARKVGELQSRLLQPLLRAGMLVIASKLSLAERHPVGDIDQKLEKVKMEMMATKNP